MPTAVALNDTRLTANGSNFVTAISAKTGTASLANYALTQAYNAGAGSSTNTATLNALPVPVPLPVTSSPGSSNLSLGEPSALYRIMADQFSQNCEPDNSCLRLARGR